MPFKGPMSEPKQETFAADIFEETSNVPASFAATRAALGVAAMIGFRAFLTDAETAYLQAVIDSPTRTPTFVELPRGVVTGQLVCGRSSSPNS